MKSRLALVAIAAIAVGGCRGTGDRAKPGSKLEHAFYFTERDQRGFLHPVSGTAVEATDPSPPVQRVADGATIDVNSKLVVDVRPDVLGRGTRVAAAGDLAEVGQSLSQALGRIADYYELGQRANAAWAAREAQPPATRERSPVDAEFKQLRRQLADMETRLLEPVTRLWPRQDPARAADRRAAEALVTQLDDAATRAAAVEGLVALTQRRLDEWRRDANAVVNAVKDESGQRRLRIEAFLVPSDGGDPSAVHVPGYDTLDQGTVSVIDRFGLALTESERTQLVALSSASQEVAAALERLRRGEATWQQTLFDVSKILPVTKSLVALSKELDAAALRTRADATRAALKTFVIDVKAAGATVAAAQEQEWQQLLQQALTANERLGELVALIQRVDALVKRWEQPTSAALPQLLIDSAALATQLVRFAEGFDGSDLLAKFGTTLDQAMPSLATGGAELADKIKKAWAPVEKDLASWRTLAEDVVGGVRQVAALFKLKRATPKLDVTNSAAIDVPLDTAQDTEIDLRLTPRRPHDLLQLRVRLLDEATGKDAVTPLTATLGVEKLGWHADLIPSVVYVTADRLAGPSDRGGFSPALSWMWNYTPRDDESNPYLSRTFDWALGLHACFLNFDPERDVQIGLGATFSVWDDRIIVGAGYNMFAETADEGRFYFFLGSSLIPLLQALNGK